MPRLGNGHETHACTIDQVRFKSEPDKGGSSCLFSCFPGCQRPCHRYVYLPKLRAGFAEGEISIVRDNARQLKFKAESTGFED